LDNLVYGDLGISETEETIVIYPNPTSDYIHIYQHEGTATLLTMDGNIVSRTDLTTTNVLSLEKFATGSYMLLVSNEKSTSQTIITKK
jgi:hypothetical protein